MSASKPVRALVVAVLALPSLSWRAAAQTSEWMLGPFQKPPAANPVLTPDRTSTFYSPMGDSAVRWEEYATFNPAAVVKHGKVYLLYRAEDASGEREIGGHTSRIGLAESVDGLSFIRRGAPVLYPDTDAQASNEWPGGVEDPRLVEREDGTYVLTYTQWNRQIPRLALATSPDLITWRKHGPAFAKAGGGKYLRSESKSGAIVARVVGERLVATRVNGTYWMYFGVPLVRIATSDDLLNWTPVEDGHGRPVTVLAPQPGRFDSWLVEPGPPAVLTPHGIVLLYNAGNSATHGDPGLPARAYSAGQALFDGHNPLKLLARSTDPFIRPTEPYERAGQYTQGTTFIEGLVPFRDRWYLYYGMADTRVGVAVSDPRGAASPAPPRASAGPRSPDGHVEVAVQRDPSRRSPAESASRRSAHAQRGVAAPRDARRLAPPAHGAVRQDADAVQVFVTTGDRTKLLTREPDLVFGPDEADTISAIEVDARHTYQTMVGFGAALTDASAWLLQNRLTPAERERLLEELFGPEPGLGLSFLRLDMGASDFSLRHYSYDDMPPGESDPTLEHFSIEPDRLTTIPLLKRARVINPRLSVMASPWSPPAWMKTTGSLIKGTLRSDAYEPLARYFQRFIEAYRAEGIPIYAVTVQNEPHYEPEDYPGMRLEPGQRARFVGRYLGPLLARTGIETRILEWDHNWDQPDEPLQVLADSTARRYVSGVAWHCYGGDVAAQDTVHEVYPDKDVFLTECSGGNWAPRFADNLVWMVRELIIGATRDWARGVLLWNLALDEHDGPHTGGCGDCRGVVTINSTDGSVTRNEEYYALGHASRFVRPGARRIAALSHQEGLEAVAFQNVDDGSIALIVVNGTSGDTEFAVRSTRRAFHSLLSAGAVATFIWSAGGKGESNHPAAPRPERDSDGDLPLARGRAAQDQVPDIGTCDQEDEPNRPEEDPHGRSHRIAHQILIPEQINPDVLGHPGVELLTERRGRALHTRPRLLQGEPGGEPTQDLEVLATPNRAPDLRERRPEIDCGHRVEARRHDAHHRERFAVQ